MRTSARHEDDLEEALEGKEILVAPNAPSSDVRAAFILDDGALVELREFETAGREEAE